MKNRIKVQPEEILFMKNHAPKGFASLVQQSLSADGVEYRRETVYAELGALKSTYNSVIIEKARELLKAVMGVEFKTA